MAHKNAKPDLLECFQSRTALHHGDRCTQHGIYRHMKCFSTIRKHMNVAGLLNVTIIDLSPITFNIKSDHIDLTALKGRRTLMS